MIYSEALNIMLSHSRSKRCSAIKELFSFR